MRNRGQHRRPGRLAARPHLGLDRRDDRAGHHLLRSLSRWSSGASARRSFPHQANGSLVKKDGTLTTDDSQAVGSALIGQNFSAPEYFIPVPARPATDTTPTSSGGSNLGPLSDKLINGADHPRHDAADHTAANHWPSTASACARIHYAVDNGITFKLYSVGADGNRTEADAAYRIIRTSRAISTTSHWWTRFPIHPPTTRPDDGDRRRFLRH